MEVPDTLKHLIMQSTKLCSSQIGIQKNVYSAVLQELQNQFYTIQTIRDANNQCVKDFAKIPDIQAEIVHVEENLAVIQQNQLFLQKFYEEHQKSTIGESLKKENGSSQVVESVNVDDEIIKNDSVEQVVSIQEQANIVNQEIQVQEQQEDLQDNAQTQQPDNVIVPDKVQEKANNDTEDTDEKIMDL